MTSNMMSQTAKCLDDVDKLKATFPSSTTYNTNNYNTITNPMVTGGAPNNQLSLIKFEKAKRMKALNPFKTNDRSHEKTVLEETAHLGPGIYFPEKAKSIGGTDLENSRKAMYSTISAKHQAQTMTGSPNNMLYNTNSGSGILTSVQNGMNLGQQSFGSSTQRFDSLNKSLKK
mmetsp:Transcript_1093/g.1283  ORF Transcript_1093/g.1283 Transcript_1093/m.1283 type:complete len:173 (-) Transcript_1093:241-759(-)